MRLLDFLLGMVLLAAGLAKCADPAGFALEVWHYRLLPDRLVVPVALVLPWLEIFTGLCLTLGRLRAGAALMACLLFSAFTLATAAALARGLDLGCGCFYPSLSRLQWPHVLFDAACGGASGWLLVRGVRPVGAGLPP